MYNSNNTCAVTPAAAEKVVDAMHRACPVSSFNRLTTVEGKVICLLFALANGLVVTLTPAGRKWEISVDSDSWFSLPRIEDLPVEVVGKVSNDEPVFTEARVVRVAQALSALNMVDFADWEIPEDFSLDDYVD